MCDRKFLPQNILKENPQFTVNFNKILSEALIKVLQENPHNLESQINNRLQPVEPCHITRTYYSQWSLL